MKENIIFVTPEEISVKPQPIGINVTESSRRIENLGLRFADRIADAIIVLACAIVASALVITFGPKIVDMIVARFSQGN